MEVTLLETCINIIQSIMIALFLRSLITNPRGKYLSIKTLGLAIIEFIFIQWMNTVTEFSGGMYKIFTVIILNSRVYVVTTMSHLD